MLRAPVGSPDEQKADDINELIFKHPELECASCKMTRYIFFLSHRVDRETKSVISCKVELLAIQSSEKET